MDQVKTTLAVVGAASVATALLVLAKRTLESRRNVDAERRCVRLQAELKEAKSGIKALKARAADLERRGPRTRKPKKKEVRMYIDGCFDMMHFGHSNALRQARALGTYLIVGLIGDEAIAVNKGAPPVMPFEERLAALRACKFVDEVISNVPYDADEEFTKFLIKEHRIDFIVHGDDPVVNTDGSQLYGYARSLGMYKEFKRTEGVSTTDLVGRMLLMNREHHIRTSTSVDEVTAASQTNRVVRTRALSDDIDLADIPETRVSTFLPTSRRIVQFSEDRAPKPTDRVVYVSGSWDLFNAGHISFLEKARALGDFLLVGINDDDTVNTEHGSGFPIMNLHERALGVLQCRYVDEAIIGAPWRLTRDMIKTMHISVVATGNVPTTVDGEPERKHDLGDPYDVAREMGILVNIDSGSDLTARKILTRVFDNRARFLKRFLKKQKKEADYYEHSKDYIQEG